MTNLPASRNIESLLESHLAHDAEASWFLAPEIPVKKLNNAIKKYAPDVVPASVLALGDGTVFGSAKEGLLLTADSIYCHTTEETFSVLLQNIESAEVKSGWPGYCVDIRCRDGSTHKILTTCYDKKQAGLVDFINSIGAVDVMPAVSPELPPANQRLPFAGETRPVPAREPQVQQTSVHETADLKLIKVCPHEGIDDVGSLFAAAIQADTEWPLLKGYCQYVGFNGRAVDAVFLLTNRRLLLFSMEMGAKIVVVELTKRLLGKLPVPFLDSLVCFFLFSIPHAIYVALRGGKKALISQALNLKVDQLLSTNSPLRKVQDLDFTNLAESTTQVDLGTNVCTGFLERKFGVTFAPTGLTKAFHVPKDMILPEYEALEPLQPLLHAIRPALASLGWAYQSDANGQKLSIVPAAADRRAAA